MKGLKTGIDMEAEKLLEQNGFSKFYESKNVVGFASMRDRLKFYEDTQTICLCDEHYEVSFSPNIIKAIYLYCEEKGWFKLQELKFNSEEMMYDDEENDLLNTYVSFNKSRSFRDDRQKPRNEIEIFFFPDECIDFDKFITAVKKKAEELGWLDE